MKVTKYPQSCLIIENDGKRALIDPGAFVTAKYSVSDLLPLDLVLITHEHEDHIDPALLNQILADTKIPVVANASTAKLLGDKVTNIIEDKQSVEIAGFKITARELPHCLMVNGSEGPQNTGYVINDYFFHPGDGIKIADFQIDKTAVPIAGPDISPKDVFDFIKDVGANTVIPIHYDFFKENPEMLKNEYFFPGVNAVILENGETAEI